MKNRRWVALIAFWLAVGGVGSGLWLTRSLPQADPPDPAQPVKAAKAGKAPKGAKAAPPRKERVIDERPLAMARSLGPFALTPEEKAWSHQAERLANHEVDLAFSDAMRQAAENPPPPTPEMTEAQTRKDAEEAALETGRRLVASLERRMATAPENEKDSLEAQIEVARAQVELDQDELEQASEDLERIGGDPQARIRRMKAAHAAADAATPPADASAALPVFYRPGSLLAKLKGLLDAKAKVAKLREARQGALDKAQKLEQRRLVFSQRVAQEKEGREAAKQKAAGFVQGGAPPEGGREDARSTLATLKAYMTGQRRLADMGKRLQDERELSEVYANWMALAEVQQRTALNTAFRYLLGILGIVLGVVLADRLLEGIFERRMKGQKRVGRMLKIIKFGTQAVGTLGILFVVFGLPGQITTFFALAGAGLTVALKDFIVAFFGWFILVGRNGIHVGDWVEIKGVGGEVVEIGLLRTLLMETGSWSDSGHPTGRVVSFVNSFAMEGHFFNFSTSGQWMWDELRLLAPQGQDPYVFTEALRGLVEKETLANAALAEKEWLQAGRQSRAQGFSALPGVNVVPTSAGVEVRVRYITRAYERHETRARLDRAVVELMRGLSPDPVA